MGIIDKFKGRFEKQSSDNQARQQDEAYEKKKRELIESGKLDAEIEAELEKVQTELDNVLKLVKSKKK